MSPTISIGGRKIGPDHEPYVIAAINSCHGGDIQLATEQIALAQKAGADAVKFQNFDAASLVPEVPESELSDQPWMKTAWEHSPKPTSLHEFYGKVLRSPSSVADQLFRLSGQLGMTYFSTPLNIKDADHLIMRHDQPAFKLTAHESQFYPLIERLARTGKPLLLNVAVSEKADVDQALAITDEYGAPVVLLTGPKLCCASPESRAECGRHFGMSRLHALLKDYPEKVVGISDHFFPTSIDSTTYHGYEFAVAAVFHGASVVSKAFSGIDCGSENNLEAQFASLTAEMKELKRLTGVAWRARTRGSLGNLEKAELDHCLELAKVDTATNAYGPTGAEIQNNEIGLQRVLTAARPMASGHRIGLGDLHFTRLVQANVPFRDQLIHSIHVSQVIGNQPLEAVPQGYPLRTDNLRQAIDLSADFVTGTF